MDRTDNQVSKYVWRNWLETNKEARVTKNKTSETKFKIIMLSQVGVTIRVDTFL